MSRHRRGASSGAPSGPSQRQLRVAELIRRMLADTLARGDLHDPELHKTAITVGEVRVSPDLRHATAYVLPLGGEGRAEVLRALERNRGELRRILSRDLSLRFSPELRFAIDETFDRLDETRRLFAQYIWARVVVAETDGDDGADDGADGRAHDGADGPGEERG
ncbi:MAG: 30S ribosome-binding factor RbfA, partial [Rhodobacteraceae bacterium]|nr:30S ribosome-binding factor RbfA [Paracoccaceae bacterium]